VIVFLHGAGCTSGIFAAQLAAFPGSVAVELPGHGVPGAPESIDAFADAVAAELERRGAREAVLCGSSMGGAIALALALRDEPHVRAIVLLDSGARLRVSPKIFEALERDFHAAAEMLARLFFADPTTERVDRAVAMIERVGQAQTMRDFRACNAFDVTARLGEIHVPLLALAGEADVLTPPKLAQFVADRVDGAQARILPGAGHLPMIEQPAETNAALRAFVTQLPSRT
jgi:3-oxoadipate enol-lactonase